MLDFGSHAQDSLEPGAWLFPSFFLRPLRQKPSADREEGRGKGKGEEVLGFCLRRKIVVSC